MYIPTPVQSRFFQLPPGLGGSIGWHCLLRPVAPLAALLPGSAGQALLSRGQDKLRGPKDHMNMRILRYIVCGIEYREYMV